MARNTYFNARGIRQINIVWNKTILLTPLRLATSALSIVAGLWFHNAHIATCQFLHANVTMPLRITFFSFFIAVAAVNIAGIA